MDIIEEFAQREIWSEEKFGDDGGIDKSGHNESSETRDNDENGEDERKGGQGLDGETEMGVEKSEEDDKNGEVDEVGSENRGEEDEGKDEAIERFGLSDALDFGAESE